MLLAAYMVVGFGLASLYAIAMLRDPAKRASRRHRLGLIIPLTVACDRHPDPALRRRRRRPRGGRPPAGEVRRLRVHRGDRAGPDRVASAGSAPTRRQVRDRDPRPRLVAGRLQHRHGRHRPRRHPRRRASRRPTRCSTSPSTRWSGSAFGLLALGAWFGDRLVAPARTCPRRKWFLRGVAVSGIGAVVALESGWIVTEVGRQPWIVWRADAGLRGGHDRGRPVVRGSAARSRSTRCSVRRPCSRCGSLVRRDAEGEIADVDIPYGPPPPEPAKTGSGREQARDRLRDPRGRRRALRDLRRRRLRRRGLGS